jgi:hypothetical protein
MTIFLVGLIIFCCGICYRIVRKAVEKKDNEMTIHESETETTTGGVE